MPPRTLVIKVTAGKDEPERSGQALNVAAAALASGVAVSLWLTGEAAWFALPGRADEVALAWVDARRATPSRCGASSGMARRFRVTGAVRRISLLCSILILRYAYQHRGLPRLVGPSPGPSPGVAGEGPAMDQPALRVPGGPRPRGRPPGTFPGRARTG